MTEPTDDRRPTPAPDGSPISFPCRRCRYEIRGISLEGLCPECGEPIWRTLAEQVDLTAAMIDPETCRRTGRLLPVAAVLVAATMALAALPPAVWPWTGAGGWLAATAGIGPASPAWAIASAILWATAGIAAGIVAAGLRDGPMRPPSPAAPPTRSPAGSPRRAIPRELARPLRRPRVLLALAAGLCLATAASGVAGPRSGLGGPFAILASGVLLLAAGLLAERLGPGSRRWRGGGAARQSPWLVVGSLATAAGLAVAGAALEKWGLEDPAALAGLLAAATMLLAIVGGLYLAANLLWVAGDLRRRRPRLERMLAEAGAGTSRDRPTQG